jgi:hypothetical protein
MDDFEARTTLTITLKDLNHLKAATEQERKRVQALESQLAEARMTDPNGVIRDLCGIVRSAKAVVQFAVGNLEPSTVRGWPYEALRAFADGLLRLPDADVQDQTLASDLCTFAKNAAGYEEYRRERDAKRVAMPASREDFGPKTAEAAFVHEARAQALHEAKEEEPK